MVLKLELPLDPGVLRVIAAVQAGAQAQGLEPMLVGAAARDLLLVHVYGQRVRRATKDVDFAVALASWEAFEQLKARLVLEHGFADEPSQVQRLVFIPEGEGAGTTIDLVPFGEPLQVNRRALLWPPEMDVYMTVSGFEEALSSAQLVELEEGLQVKVASLPGLTILKLFAWGDRRQRDSKDAVDLQTLLRSYGAAGNFDRMTDQNQAWDRFFSLDCDEEKTGAWLLGLDAGRIVSSETMASLRELLGDTNRREQLIDGMASEDRGVKGARQKSDQLLGLFMEGLEEGAGA
ncbi:MAG: nucleotidyl transferase AbiEii/AbiGii toxin family protein [Cyanobium sp.]|nr:nucleotidyl transferase AbiEii/AbiGii toxin family protein [Cyanobium sp.]